MNNATQQARPAQEAAWTSRLWVYDLRTNMHFTLKTNPLKRADLAQFAAVAEELKAK